MENIGKMENWKMFLNKKVKVIYDDGNTYPSKKVGTLLQATDTHLILAILNSSQALLLSKILRVEEVQE